MNNLSSQLPLITTTNTTIEEEEEEKARCEWDFKLTTVISSQLAPNTTNTDAIGVIEFDPTNTLIATGGIARKIRIYDVGKSLINSLQNNVVLHLDHATACEFYLCAPAKLSSLKWKPGSGSRVIGSGDYDGVVTEYDLEKRVPVFERDEHGGRRVWSMDYSHSDPVLGGSGSDDGTMQMWDPRVDGGRCLGSVKPNRVFSSPVCCVEFDPFGKNGVAVGCADRRVYGYDLRNLVDPVFVLEGHEKAVTYVRFLNSDTLVSSSVDGSLMTWQIGERRLVRVYKGHANSRRFVGLSIWRKGGLLCCGSENNEVFVYDMRWGDPIWIHGFEAARCGGQGFVSDVCWRQTEEERCTLVAGDSDGVLQVFEGQRKLGL